MKRVLILLAVVGAATLSLTGCEKPTPGVSVVSGTSSQHKEALCWGGDGSVTAESCSQEVIAAAAAGGSAIPVIQGDTVGISVDTAVADLGWIPIVNAQPLTQEPLHTTYYRFTYDSAMASAQGANAVIVLAGDGQTAKGLWVFGLSPQAG